MEESKEICYCVKIDNIKVNESMKATNVIYASSTEELMDKICKRYDFKENNKKYLQLWSGQLGTPQRERLDQLECIPNIYDTIWIRAVLNNNT